MTAPLGRYAAPDDGPLVAVHLLATPVLLWERATEHHDELVRELSLLALRPDPALPEDLLALVQELGDRQRAVAPRPDAERQAAIAAGLDRIDLTFRVPASSGPAARRMRADLDAVETYCREGALLTLEQPPEIRAFGHWYADQVADQAEGAAPVPWPGPWQLQG